MVSPEDADQTERGGGDDLESEKCATRNEYYRLLKRNAFLGTRFPHPETMERLGIYDDDDGVRPDGSLGYLEFCVYDLEYRLPIKHLELMYGFPSEKDTNHRFDKKELQSFWATLGSLASALFAREGNGTFVNGELELMEPALQELLGLASDGTVLARDQTDASVSFYLIEHLLSYKGWAKGLKKPGRMVVGGVMTPILRACNVPLHLNPIAPRWIDMQHLINSKNFCNIEFCPPIENLYGSGDEVVPMEGVNDDETPIRHSDNEAEPMDESYASQQFYFEKYSAPRQKAQKDKEIGCWGKPLDQQPEQRVEHPTNPSPAQPAPWSYIKESMDDLVFAYFT
ncbi:putative protein [Arabidopsis thaliana]|uniref:Uncharacterized protein F7M19_140 n=1 Tax=Arabidopsis thaliana TaxID=3702 RepID=Q9M248_ARATH|nr:putative protein [Arabidopsis thaliana]